jgi:hypothetical protein
MLTIGGVVVRRSVVRISAPLGEKRSRTDRSPACGLRDAVVAHFVTH